MQLKIYSVILILSISLQSLAQELFPKKELYHVWIIAGEDLDSGKFDDALRLYNTHAENPSFASKVRQIARLKEINAEADRLVKRKQYADAVDKFKEYRKLKDMSTLAFFERKIEHCLNQINKGKLTELTSQQRIITGFEFAHRGREKLTRLDTSGAKKDFNNAKNLGGNRNIILKEQYVEGIHITNALTKWGNDFLKTKTTDYTKAQELAALESYRSIRNIDIPELELKIKELRNNLNGLNTLPEIAKLCDAELLIKYVNSNKASIQSSGFLLSRLNEFSSAKKKIALLKNDPANNATVTSAYASLFSWLDDLPMEIREEMRNCVQIDYSEYLSSFPTPIAAKTPTIQSSVASKCAGQEDFDKGLSLIRKELHNCNPIRARSLWRTNMAYIANCEEKEILIKKNRTLLDSILLMTKSDSLMVGYREQIKRMLQKGECSKTAKIYEQMKSLKVCNTLELNQEIEAGLRDSENCKQNNWWKAELIGGLGRTIPRYKIGNNPMKMDQGWIKSAGVQISYIDHKNPFDFLIGAEYVGMDFYSLGNSESIKESFIINSTNIFFAIKLHAANTQPDRVRPYFRFGPEIMIPISYNYTNHFNSSQVSGLDQLQRTVLSSSGSLGLEIQKKHFGAFVEGFCTYGLGSVYNSGQAHITTTNEKVDARLIKIGAKVGIRIW